MFKKFFYVLAVLFLLFNFTACSDDDTGGTGSDSSGTSVSSGSSSSPSGGTYGTTVNETFETLSISSYTTATITLDNGYDWDVTDVYPEGSSTAHGGSKALRINDDKPSAGIISPAMNGLGTISFWYRTLNSEGSPSTFKVQVSVSGGTWSDVDSGSFQGQDYQQFSATVNNPSQNLRFRILSDNQAGHLIIDDIQWTTDGMVTGGGSSSSTPSSTSSAASSTSSVSSSYSSISVAAAPAWISAFTGEADGQSGTILDASGGWINLYVSSVTDLNNLGAWKIRCGNFKYINDLMSSSDLPGGWSLQDGDTIRIHESAYTGTTDSAKSDNNAEYWDYKTASTYFADSSYGTIWLEDGSGNVLNIVAYTTDLNTSDYWVAPDDANPLERLQFAVAAGIWTSDQLSGAFSLSPYASKLARLKTPGSAGSSAADWETADVLVDDNDNPTVTITSPTDGDTVNAYSVSLTGTAADATSGVASVQVKVDSGAWEGATGTTSWSFSTGMLSETSHVIAVRSIDNGGNISTEQSITVTISHPPDNDNPTVTVTTPTDGTTLSNLAPTFEGTANDPGTTPSGLSNVQVRVDSGSWQPVSGTTFWSYTPSSDLSEGSHTFEFKAVDNKGNESTITTISLTLYAPAGLTQDTSLPSAVQSYYSAAYGKSGLELYTALHNIIDGHTDRGYDGLYTIYQDSDITSDGKVWDIYSANDATGLDRPYTFNWTDNCGSYSVEGDCFNREHVIPQSKFDSHAPMKADAHHVIPTDGKVNGMRSSYTHGNVSSATKTSQNGSMLGPCSDPGFSGTAFEPIDCYKGDVARMYFYFAIRYKDNSSCMAWEAMNAGAYLKSWIIPVLIQWHIDDPVDQKEIDRNNAIAQSIHQGNRNPFIDYPSAVEWIWGTPSSPITY